MAYIQINGGIAKAIDDSLKLKSNDTLSNDMDEHIFEEIYRSHVKTIYRYCLFRTNSYQDAEDITAEVFIKLLQDKKVKNRSAYILPWLLKVAANLSINHNRKSNRRKFAEQAAYSRTDDSLDPWHDNEIWHEVKKLVLAVFFGNATFRTPSEKLIIEKAIAAINKPNKILYYKITSSAKNGYDWESENWVDEDNKLFKSVHRSFANEKEYLVTRTLIKDGVVLSTEESGGMVYVSESKSRQFTEGLNNEATKYKELLERGEAELLGEEKVNGVETYKLKIILEQGIATNKKEREVLIQIVNIRQDNYWPLKMTYDYLSNDQKRSESQADDRETIYFKDVRFYDLNTLGQDFFTMDIPDDANYSISKTYSIDEAKDFKEFDLYWLGPEFEGYTAEGFIDYRKDLKVNIPKNTGYGKGEPPYVSQNEARMYYTKPGDNEGFGPVIRPADHPFAKEPFLPLSTSKKSTINIEGKECTLIETNYKQQGTVYQLFVPMGNASVELSSGNKEFLIKAAKSLKKLN